ncbi:glycosyltransferase [Xylanimonas oleitrophica]|uniref:Glycosyltransferase n=1 Tax=Xylanimonas oleitrophica TaxID=2607479 RepID=A0A2W5XUW8_9MICO|nr:glycosyltransferase family 2 protein [Xylanimonas oleitrophica]PZR54158.1 glycosyltransferase [Xylanimonas oleitrophica]
MSRRRQWGAERRTEPLPIQHPRPTTGKIARSRVAIVLTVTFWLLYVISTVLREFIDSDAGFRFSVEAVAYVVTVSALGFSALMYLLAREGALTRFRDHQRTTRSELDRFFARRTPSLTVLVPSYAEETDVVRATLLSTALQEYPDLRVVLLLDDPINPSNPADAARVEATKSLPEQINRLLATPRRHVEEAHARFVAGRPEGTDPQTPATPAEVQALAAEYRWAARWTVRLAAVERTDDHVGTFLDEQVYGKLAEDLETTAAAIEAGAVDGQVLPVAALDRFYQRMVRIFTAEVSVFQRKAWVSTSHEANKAMNLNSYLALMGGTYRIEQTLDGLGLAEVEPGDEHVLTVPDSDYVLTLDADSVLLREYCLRLVHFLEQPGNERVGVVQTPYSAFRGAATRIERLAGATTDIQHMLHQGMTQFGATFWVGANAVIRKRALDDIVEVESVGGYEVRRYIQDRTVIEDTESSIDLATHGWTLVNYPERLSYSATPPDFGSLVVQRRRWANGGLLIMPKFFAHVRTKRRQGTPVRLAEQFLRVNYMASTAWASVALVLLLAYPYDGRLLSPLVLLMAAGYFISMASDLKQFGYKRSDVFRIYGFNLILLTVNLAGVLKSLQQAVTGAKIPFARTPKVKDRTAAPLLHVMAPLVIVGFSVFSFVRDFQLQNWGNAAFAGFNTVMASYAIVAYIGVGALLVDIGRGLVGWFWVDVPDRRPQGPPERGWHSVLTVGSSADGTAAPLELAARESLAHARATAVAAVRHGQGALLLEAPVVDEAVVEEVVAAELEQFEREAELALQAAAGDLGAEPDTPPAPEPGTDQTRTPEPDGGR